jgi:hypothetical protein
MNQIFLGASIPFAIALLYYILRRGRISPGMLVFIPFFLCCGVLWAAAPDIPRLLGMHDLYMKLANDPTCDIFLWHYTIDQTEIESPLFSIGVMIIALSLLYAAWREIKRAEET